MAPELLDIKDGSNSIEHNVVYDPQEADVFAIMVCLFIMVFSSYPFNEATSKDNRYYSIIHEDYGRYWEKNPHVKISDEMKDLFERAFASNPAARLSIPDILAHEWMQGYVTYKSQNVPK